MTSKKRMNKLIRALVSAFDVPEEEKEGEERTNYFLTHDHNEVVVNGGAELIFFDSLEKLGEYIIYLASHGQRPTLFELSWENYRDRNLQKFSGSRWDNTKIFGVSCVSGAHGGIPRV